MTSSDIFSITPKGPDIYSTIKEFLESECQPELYGELLCVFGGRSKACRVFVNALSPENKGRLLALVRNRCFGETVCQNEGGAVSCKKFCPDYISAWRRPFSKAGKATIFSRWFRAQTKPVRKLVYFSVSHDAQLEALCAPLLL